MCISRVSTLVSKRVSILYQNVYQNVYQSCIKTCMVTNYVTAGKMHPVCCVRADDDIKPKVVVNDDDLFRLFKNPVTL